MSWIRKHWGKVLAAAGGCLVFLVILVAAAPSIIGYGPVRNFLLYHLFNGQQVAVSVEGVSVGWFRPTEIENLRVHQNEGKYNIGVPRIANDVTLFRLLSNPRQLGNLVIEEPLVVIELPDEQADLITDGPSDAPSLDEAKVQSALQRTIDIQVVDATVEVRKPGVEKPWGFQNIQFLGQLRPGRTTEEGPSILIPAATLMDRQELTQEMCNDLLKFAAPIVTGVTKVNGEASLSLEGIRVPLADRQSAVGKGTLTIHKAQLTGTPLVQKITEFIGLGPSVEVFSDCEINFELADKRIYHEGLDFGIGNLRVQTHGYVGLDKTLDLVAVVPVPLAPSVELLEGEKPNPILTALRGKTVEIPIIGTLDKPEVDTAKFGRSLMATAELTLKEILRDEDIRLDLQGEDGEVDVTRIMGLAGALVDGANREGGLMDQFRERREANLNAAGDANHEKPKEGFFRRLPRRNQVQPRDINPADPAVPEAIPLKPDLDGAIDL